MAEIARRVKLGNGIQEQHFIAQEDGMSQELKKIYEAAGYNGVLIDKYELLDNAYRASGGFEDGSYLIPHPREQAEKYIRRKNMSYYINYVKPVVDGHVNPIFKSKPIRKGLSPTYEKFIQDVDGNGTTLTRFMKKAAIRAKLHGVEFIIVDMEQLEEGQIVTEKDVIDQRLYPYLYLVSPAQVTNWAVDKFGKMIYFSYTITSNSIDDNGNIKSVGETYTWTNNYCIRQIQGEEKRKYVNPLGIIPVVPLYGAINDSDTLIPQSDVYAIARTNYALYNACSEERERARSQAFSMLIYPIADDDDYSNGDEPLQYGTADMLLYRGTTHGKPEFITPPTDSTDILLAEINFMIKEIYRMANMQFVTGVSQYNISGIVKEWDSQQLFQTISELAQGLQEAEYKIAKVFSKYMSEIMDNISITYNNQYGIVDSTSVLTNATQALTLNICGDYNLALKEQVVRATLKDIDSSAVDTILQSLRKDPTAKDGLESEAKLVQPSTSGVSV